MSHALGEVMPFSVSKYISRMSGGRSHTFTITDEQVYAWHAQLEAAKVMPIPVTCTECDETVARNDYLCLDCRVRFELTSKRKAEEQHEVQVLEDMRLKAMEDGYRQAVDHGRK